MLLSVVQLNMVVQEFSIYVQSLWNESSFFLVSLECLKNLVDFGFVGT